MAAKAKRDRERRTLAAPLVQDGALRQAGEPVELRPDQIARLEAQGVVTPVEAPAPANESDGKETAR